jgi:AraC family transcriptional regulator
VQANLERRSTAPSSIRALSSETQIRARVAHTENVRIEFLRCGSQATVQWSVVGPQISLMWVRGKSSNGRITMAGREVDGIRPGRAKFWFFPEGTGAEGELTGRGAYDCAGVFVEPSFLPLAVKPALSEPIAGFSHDALGRAFDEMAGELAQSNEMLSIFAEGWAMQALAYVARATRKSQSIGFTTGSGLAQWQLHRAKEMLLADFSENPSLDSVAAACRLSSGHFQRAFKASTGVPAHKWLVTARIERARALLMESTMSLADVAGICGFADQSHFSNAFARMMGTSPGAWRRAHSF